MASKPRLPPRGNRNPAIESQPTAHYRTWKVQQAALTMLEFSVKLRPDTPGRQKQHALERMAAFVSNRTKALFTVLLVAIAGLIGALIGAIAVENFKMTKGG